MSDVDKRLRVTHTCGLSNKTGCPCYKERRRKLRSEQRDKLVERHRQENLARYGLSVEDYEALREAQEYRCAICQRHEDELPKKGGGRPRVDGSSAAESAVLSVDHCHNTGDVRGLLCRGCNSVVGMAEGNHPTNSGYGYPYLSAVHTYLSSGYLER